MRPVDGSARAAAGRSPGAAGGHHGYGRFRRAVRLIQRLGAKRTLPHQRVRAPQVTWPAFVGLAWASWLRAAGQVRPWACTHPAQVLFLLGLGTVRRDSRIWLVDHIRSEQAVLAQLLAGGGQPRLGAAQAARTSSFNRGGTSSSRPDAPPPREPWTSATRAADPGPESVS